MKTWSSAILWIWIWTWINQLTSINEFSGVEYPFALERLLWYDPGVCRRVWDVRYKCGARLYEVDVNCVAKVEQRERGTEEWWRLFRSQ
jgi:hypothetical protein